jgi:polyphosphate kinase 2 (PPK2 family)
MINLEDFEKDQDTPTMEGEEKNNLQERLYLLLKESSERKFLTIIVLEGWSGSGKGELLRFLTERLDPRKFKVYSPKNTGSEDKRHHFLRKFWMHMPEYGNTLILLNSWYSPLSFSEKSKKKTFEKYLNYFRSILFMERVLSQDHVMMFKFFLHISKKEQKARFKTQKNISIFSPEDKHQMENYSEFKENYEIYLDKTNSHYAPWNIIPASSTSSAKNQVIRILIEELENKMGVNSLEMLDLIKKGEDILS